MNTDTASSGDMPAVVVVFLIFIAVDIALTIARAYSNKVIQRQLDIHEQRLDTAAAHRGSISAGLNKVSDTSVTHSKCCVQLLSSYNDLDKRLSLLETDGK